jgi:putative heme-binding domain-containing protein
MNQMLKNNRTLFWMTILAIFCTLWFVPIKLGEVVAQTSEQLWNPFTGNEEAIAQGKLFFQAFCWGCHGVAGHGGKAPDLLQPQWLYGWSEAGVFQTVYNGLPGTGMQKFGGKLTDEEIWKVISYVRMEQAKAAGVTLAAGVKSTKDFVAYLEGDTQAGEALFFSEDIACGKCHTVRGKGSYGKGSETGPDLTYIARTRSPHFIMESILNSRAYIAPEFETITLITKAGKEITGRKRKILDRDGNEDPEAVQVLDSSGKLWTTYFKKDLEKVFTPKTSIMPENFAQILTVKQLHDLFAYLMTLK